MRTEGEMTHGGSDDARDKEGGGIDGAWRRWQKEGGDGEGTREAAVLGLGVLNM
jgi:hypothetical protein